MSPEILVVLAALLAVPLPSAASKPSSEWLHPGAKEIPVASQSLERQMLPAREGTIHRAVPSEVDTESRYVIYLHGRIIEDEGVRPTHPQFGVYEYEAILKELAGYGLEVISEVRPPSADGAEYARRTAQQVRELIAAGVPEDHITVMGFSKGGAIAILTSWELQEPAVRYVWLAACGDWAFRMSALVPAGRILSIHEASDNLGVSCAPLFARSDLIEGKEVRRTAWGLLPPDSGMDRSGGRMDPAEGRPGRIAGRRFGGSGAGREPGHGTGSIHAPGAGAGMGQSAGVRRR